MARARSANATDAPNGGRWILRQQGQLDAKACADGAPTTKTRHSTESEPPIITGRTANASGREVKSDTHLIRIDIVRSPGTTIRDWRIAGKNTDADVGPRRVAQPSRNSRSSSSTRECPFLAGNAPTAAGRSSTLTMLSHFRRAARTAYRTFDQRVGLVTFRSMTLG